MNIAGEPTWSNLQEAVRVVAYPRFLKKTLGTALLVGVVQFLINHLDELLRGQAQKRLRACDPPKAMKWAEGYGLLWSPIRNWRFSRRRFSS